MSSYLVAFAVTDFGHLVGKSQPRSKVAFTVWARKNAINQE
jgi:aminopeptidase N